MTTTNWNHQYSPLPDEICAGDEKSFAGYTLRHRLPHIIKQIISDNDYPTQVRSQLESLTTEIVTGKILPLSQPRYVDSAIWEQCLQVHLGKSWFEAPFFFAEMYFYRRIGEIVGTLDANDETRESRDPFALRKQASLNDSMAQVSSLIQWLETTQSYRNDNQILEALSQILLANLWANCADLSQLPNCGSGDRVPALWKNNDQLLIDDSDAMVAYVLKNAKPLDRIDIILDNTGIELISDLVLADFLLTTNLVDHVVLHAKAQPVFVSDVMKHDVLFTLRRLLTDESVMLRLWGQRLQDHIAYGRLVISDHYFWTLPLYFSAMTPDLQTAMQTSQLLISKGDANYRRLVGDRHWNLSTSIHEIVNYLPCPCLALRVLKSEILVGLSQNCIPRLNLKDDWMTNGSYGIIQFV